MKQEVQYKENPWERQYYGEKGLPVIRFLEGVTRIGAYAFGECREITEITMPKSLQMIEGHAFYNCRSLHTIRFLGAVPEIEDGAFKNCGNVKYVELFEAEEKAKELFAGVGAGAFRASCIYLKRGSETVSSKDKLCFHCK